MNTLLTAIFGFALGMIFTFAYVTCPVKAFDDITNEMNIRHQQEQIWQQQKELEDMRFRFEQPNWKRQYPCP